MNSSSDDSEVNLIFKPSVVVPGNSKPVTGMPWDDFAHQAAHLGLIKRGTPKKPFYIYQDWLDALEKLREASPETGGKVASVDDESAAHWLQARNLRPVKEAK
jgi:hypothetical protein